MADLVRLREKFQVTIPAGLRQQLALREGDYLEVSIDGNGIVLRPHSSARSRKERTLLDFLSDPVSGGRSREDIDTSLNSDRDAWDK